MKITEIKARSSCILQWNRAFVIVSGAQRSLFESEVTSFVHDDGNQRISKTGRQDDSGKEYEKRRRETDDQKGGGQKDASADQCSDAAQQNRLCFFILDSGKKAEKSEDDYRCYHLVDKIRNLSSGESCRESSEDTASDSGEKRIFQSGIKNDSQDHKYEKQIEFHAENARN